MRNDDGRPWNGPGQPTWSAWAAKHIVKLDAEVERLRMAEAEAMALVVSHEGHIAKLDAEIERLQAALKGA